MALTRVSPALFATSNNVISTTVGGSANTVSLTFDGSGIITSATNNAISVANTQITGILSVTNGGTGASTLTANSVVIGNGTGAVQFVAPGTTGNVLISNGTTWSSSVSSGGFGAGGSTLSGSQTLTSSSDGAINVNFTASFQSVTLPNATTESEAAFLYNINNTSAFIGTLYDAAGSILGFIPAGSSVSVGLADNTTSAGTWIVSGHQTLGVTSELGSSLSFSQFIDLGTSRYLLYSTTGSMFVYNSSTNTIGSVYTPPIASYDITVLDTDKLLIMYPNSTSSTTAYNVRVITISGTTLTAQTAYTTSNTFTNTTSPSYFQVVALSTGLVVMHYYNSVSTECALQAVSISGNVCTIGTVSTYSIGASSSASDIARFSATEFIAHSSRGGTYGGLIAGSVSGTTITLGTTREDNLGGAFPVIIDSTYYTDGFGVGKKFLFRVLGNGRVVYAIRAASGQGNFTRIYCCGVSSSTVTRDSLDIQNDNGSTDFNMASYAIFLLTSNTFWFAWTTNAGPAVKLTHITNTTVNTLTRGAANEIEVVPTTSSGSNIFYKATPDGAYMIAKSYGTTPTYSVAKFTLSGVTPTLTSRKDVSLNRLGNAASLTTGILGITSSNTKAHLVTVNGSVESDLSFTSFKENTVVINSVVDNAARVYPLGTKSVYLSSAGSLKTLEASK